MNIRVINGPNLNMLGIREPGIYGNIGYKALCDQIKKHAKEKGVKVKLLQSNH
ncbi:MAG: type II 3-dehydroquinate dehydratase, partial [Lachnospiraceae bacterium]|nr:type II 3-dehydroquinate dehydratase [Lachnospiraceae bacterium]